MTVPAKPAVDVMGGSDGERQRRTRERWMGGLSLAYQKDWLSRSPHHCWSAAIMSWLLITTACAPPRPGQGRQDVISVGQRFGTGMATAPLTERSPVKERPRLQWQAVVGNSIVCLTS